MEPDEAQQISERDQLWASLRGLRPEIERLARGEWDYSTMQAQLVVLLSRIVMAELRFREEDARPPDPT